MKLATEIKRLKGTLQPCRTNPNEPVPREPLGSPPAYLERDEKVVWKELARMCVPGVLTIQDRFVVELLCQLISRMRQRDPPLSTAERSNLTFCFSHLGLTPADRSRISVAPLRPDDEDDIQQFIS